MLQLLLPIDPETDAGELMRPLSWPIRHHLDAWDDDELSYVGWTCRPVAPPTVGDRKILSLFDTTGEWSRPYREAGYQVAHIDLLNDWPCDVMTEITSWEWFADYDLHDIWGVLAALPCTDFAGSGARWWQQKDADGRTELSVALANRTLQIIEYLRPAWWVLENPVGRLNRLVPELQPFGPWYFQPHEFGDPYTKKTGLWGQFNHHLRRSNVEPTEGSKMHKIGPGPDRQFLRSITPAGFSQAFFDANP